VFIETEVETPAELVTALDELRDELRMGTVPAAEAAALALIMKFRFEAARQAKFEADNFPDFAIRDGAEHEAA